MKFIVCKVMGFLLFIFILLFFILLFLFIYFIFYYYTNINMGRVLGNVVEYILDILIQFLIEGNK